MLATAAVEQRVFFSCTRSFFLPLLALGAQVLRNRFMACDLRCRAGFFHS